MEKVSLESYAKVNLTLQIVNKRSDGYHNISTIFQEIDLNDKIIMEKKESGCDFSTNVDWLNNDSSNLCIKAWKRMAEEFDIGGVAIYLNKQIPAGSGLGGGSSNAATVIKGLKHLYNLNVSDGDLEELAVDIGADVPFFIRGGLQIGEGLGDQLKKIKSFIQCVFLLVIPRILIDTAWAYDQCKKILQSSRMEVNFASFLERGEIPFELFENDFETIVVPAYPEIGNIKEMLLNHGVRFASLSGTGSTVYGIFDNEADAISVESSFPTSYKTFIVQPRLDIL